ncbi:VOC family protein [Baaleninema simplex]|uniref:VOC family protein n=1 Tax=Baaleninema simplex TaxID=2862350 RepID=UPI00034B1CC4|nr:VOC family protein [Baaleninema simplex]
MQVTRYFHTAVLVSDLERAECFYSEVLGLPKIDRPMTFPGTWYGVGDAQLHLIVADSFEENLENTEKWGRNRHVAFGVTDLPAVEQKLRIAGYPVQRSASGREALFTRDPDGNVVELSAV